MYTLTILKEKEKYRADFEGTPTVQQVLETNGIAMSHPCGGTGRCGKCEIEIIGNISVPDEKELAADCRLSCRTKLYGNATVILHTDTNLLAETVTENITASSEESIGIGAAVDIGTTTIALSVYDLTTGSCLASETMLNPQSTVAADVIGRISAACNGRLSEQQNMVLSGLQTLAELTGFTDQIEKWCITGNTTMLYLFQGKNPKSLAAAPFAAEHLFGETTVFLGKPAYIPNCIHAFVGADITCAVLASGMCNKEETALLCDIGTNGEIALWKNGKLYTASTAAGPVFEGAGISHGCQSIVGAIEAVTIKDHTFSVKTIGNAKAVGLCGSGVIDAVACFLENGTIDETGAMEEDKILLYENIFFTREDIRNVQLAKAAIAAGIQTLLSLTNAKPEDISAFYIAGGFGTHLNLNSAIRIGLFPMEFKNKVTILGNAALKGAASMLTDTMLIDRAHNIVENTECINLGGNSTFNKFYIDEMFFPEQ